MEALLKLDKAALSKPDEDGLTPVHKAMQNEDAKVTVDDTSIKKILAIDRKAYRRKDK